MIIKKKVVVRNLTFISAFILLISCTPEKKITNKKYSESKELDYDLYVCPSECSNGMTYYMEGKCDICHDNLIKQE